MSSSAATATVPRAALIGAASGIALMGVFGTLWAAIGIAGLQGAARQLAWLGVVAAVLGAALVATAVHFFRLASRLPSTAPEQRAERRCIQRRFGIVAGAECVLMGVTSSICGALGRLELMMPLMLVIAGVHFLPLASVLRNPMHYVSGTLLVAVALVTLLAFPARSTFDGHDVITWWIVSGAGASVILWLTGAWLIVITARMARAAGV